MATCTGCIHLRPSFGGHNACAGGDAVKKVEVSWHGYVNGWAFWPGNFDPIWIEACDGRTVANAQEKAA